MIQSVITSRRQTLAPFLLAVMSGLGMGLTPAPVNAWFLAWIAVVPLWVLVIADLQTARENPPGRRAIFLRTSLLGLLWGVGYHGLALSWITGIHPMTWLGVPWLSSLIIALFAWGVITLWGAVLVGLWSVGFRLLCQWSQEFSLLVKRPILQSLWRVLIGTGLWCGLEAFWGLGPLLWTSLSYTQSPHNLVILHLGQVSGPLTVTAAIVAVNGLLAEAWLRGSPRSLVRQGFSFSHWHRGLLSGAIALGVVLHLIGWGLYSRPLNDQATASLNVGIIQGNVPNSIKLYPEGWQRAIAGYTTGYELLADQGVDAVLTPETALPYLWSESNSSSFQEAIRRKGVTAWVGAIGTQGNNITNSLFTVTGTGAIYSRYDKVQLVPLGEYIPFRSVLGQLINRLSPLDAHMVPGERGQIIETPWGRAIVGICYDSAFAEHFRVQAAAGGAFILSASNNAHYSAAMPAQHHAQDVMRAIENDRWTVRATNTGYSAIVDPHGQTQWLSSLNAYALHRETIYRRQTQTLYVRWGNWLTPLLLGAVGGGWCLGLVQKFR